MRGYWSTKSDTNLGKCKTKQNNVKALNNDNKLGLMELDVRLRVRANVCQQNQ